MGEGLSLKEWGSLDLSLSFSCGPPSVSNLGVVWLREASLRGKCWSLPAAVLESPGSFTLDCSESHYRAGFGHSNFPSWLQFRSVTFFESSKRKMLRLDGIQVRKINSQRLLKPRGLLSQHKFLGADIVWDKLRGAQPRGCLSRPSFNEHFWDHGEPQRGVGDAPPHRHFAISCNLQVNKYLHVSSQGGAKEQTPKGQICFIWLFSSWKSCPESQTQWSGCQIHAEGSCWASSQSEPGRRCGNWMMVLGRDGNYRNELEAPLGGEG